MPVGACVGPSRPGWRAAARENRLRYRSRKRRLVSDPEAVEPGQRPLPPVLRIRLPVARTIVGMETVRRIIIDNDLDGLVRRLRLGLGLLYRLHRNPGILTAIQAQQRAFQVSR